MLRKLPLCAALLAAPGVAQAKDWRAVDHGGDYGAMIFVDLDSIHADDRPYRKAWVMIVLRADSGKSAALNGLIEFDCAHHRRHGVQGMAYDAAGKAIQTAGAEQGWSDTTAGTLFASAEALVCSGGANPPAERFGEDPPIERARELLERFSAGAAKP